MSVRRNSILSFIAGSVFGAAVLWLSVVSPKLSGTSPPVEASGVGRSDPVDAGIGRASTMKSLEERLDRTAAALARERETVARLAATLEEARSAGRTPLPGSRRQAKGPGGFDPEALRAVGFAPEDIEWIRRRWERAETEKRYLADLEDRGDEPPPGGGVSTIERELREDLQDGGYDAMLYATHRDNRVALVRVRKDSIAARAGIGEDSVVWSYDGRRVFGPEELANLSSTGTRGGLVEVVILIDGVRKRLSVERGPLGAELISARAKPRPNL